MRCWPARRRRKLHITRFRHYRRRKLAHSAAPPLSTRKRFAGLRAEVCWGDEKAPGFHFFGASMCVGVSLPSVCASCCRNTECAGGHRGLLVAFSLSAGTHVTPAPNRAHSGSHAETWGVFRVDGDDVLGSGIINPIAPFQTDQTVAVALAEGHRDTVSP